MSKRKCGLCGRDPAAGHATHDGVFYCHGDDDPEPTCYMRAHWAQSGIPDTGEPFAGLPYSKQPSNRVLALYKALRAKEASGKPYTLRALTPEEDVWAPLLSRSS